MNVNEKLNHSSNLSATPPSEIWFHPPRGSIKINTDTSLSSDFSGIGFLFRDHKGQVLKFVSSLLQFDLVKVGKALAIRMAIQYALEYGLVDIQIESGGKELNIDPNFALKSPSNGIDFVIRDNLCFVHGAVLVSRSFEAAKIKSAVVATTRRFPSDSGAFADWVASSSPAGRADDLSLGFNAAPASGGAGNGAGTAASPWSSAASRHQINYGLPSDMGMVGLRDVFLVAPASSFHPNTQHQEPIISDHHHHHHHHQINNSNAAAAAAAATTLGVGNQQSNFLKKPMLLDHTNSANFLNTGEGGAGVGSNAGGGFGIASTSSSTATCQDCGNQAKKDCPHRRCRTCCKSRGFDCATHVKSTWVPAARRRERQLSAAAVTAAGGSSGSTSGVKKPRLINSQTTTTSHTSTSNNTPPRSFDTSSSHQDASFRDALPGQIRAPAIFKCVRVTAIDDGEDEYAYQAVVKIGGHVFKGFLYDQGVEGRDGFPNLSELHLSGGGGGGGRNGGSSSSPIIDPSDVYAASSGGLLGGLLGFI
ncbi:hypothetical protein NE237_004848 [Protea cynaroides]|uniref:Uncharacterized protein n=1 Tax=Protea cynaroides TaxID=273540 RepID=A0A9Q0KJP6_9MAGN|nr:hypothetical protein NE237_004848 [Protea cynaroides]